MTGRPLQLEVAAVPRLALNGEEACAALGVSWDFFNEHVGPSCGSCAAAAASWSP
jgi:hypothetical protein